MCVSKLNTEHGRKEEDHSGHLALDGLV